jgi:hypothetical protein
MICNDSAKAQSVGFSSLIWVGLHLIFAMDKGPNNEDDFSDNVTGNRQGADQAQEDCKGIALVAQGERDSFRLQVLYGLKAKQSKKI